MTDPISRDVFAEHAKAEEAHQRIVSDALEEGNKRMEKIEEDLRPVKNLYHTVVGASMIGTALVGLLIFIYVNDRETIKTLSESVQRQGLVLEKMIQSHQELEKDTTKEFQRFEKTLEKLHGVK